MDENIKSLGMKWHKFMVYFVLWVGALGTVRDALPFLDGSVYGSLREQVYQVFPFMQWLDRGYALFLAAIAVYMLYILFQLAGFKKGAPKKLLSLYVIDVVALFVYLLAAAMITGISIINKDNAASILGSVLSSVVLFFVNKKYYDNRRELFIN